MSKKKATRARRFKTDYAGFWSGHCLTRESAVIAAMKRMVRDCCTRATVTDLDTGIDVVRLTLSADRTRATVTAVEPFRRIDE